MSFTQFALGSLSMIPNPKNYGSRSWHSKINDNLGMCRRANESNNIILSPEDERHVEFVEILLELDILNCYSKRFYFWSR